MNNANVHTAEVLSPRAMLFMGIVALHAVFGYLLATGLMRTSFTLLKPEMEGVIIPDREQPPPVVPKVIDPELDPVGPIPVPVPDIGPIIDEQPLETAFVGTVIEPSDHVPVAQPVTPVEPPVRLVGQNVFPNADSYYPPSERRVGREGTALVRACVDEKGKLNGAAVVETSSGSSSLDNAALRVAKDARYARSMKGDAPVPNCHRFRVTFTLSALN